MVAEVFVVCRVVVRLDDEIGGVGRPQILKERLEWEGKTIISLV